MEWSQILALILGNGALIIPLFLWNRAESRNDWRHMDVKMDSMREETNVKMDSMREETNQILRGIQTEMKDFHGKLERQDAEFKAYLMYEHKK